MPDYMPEEIQEIEDLQKINVVAKEITQPTESFFNWLDEITSKEKGKSFYSWLEGD